MVLNMVGQTGQLSSGEHAIHARAQHVDAEAHVRMARVRPSVRCYTSGGLRIERSGLLLSCCGEFGVDFRCNGKAVSSPPLDDVVWRRVGSGVVLLDRGLVVFWLRKRPMCTRTSFLEFRFLRQNVPEATRVKNRQLWFFLRKGGTAMVNRIDNLVSYTT